MKHFRILILAALLPVTMAATAQDIHSRWVATPVVVDGNPSDWPQPFTFYNTATKLEYAIANDTANLYICIKITDEQTGMRVFRGGMHVWLDPKGKKKEGTGIAFPMKASEVGGEVAHPESGDRPQVPGEAPTFKKHGFNEVKARIALHQVNMKVTGLFGIADQVLPLKNGYGVTAAFAWDSLNTLCIEYQVPIAVVLRHYLSAADTLNAIGLGITENAVDMGNRGPRADGEGGGWGGDNGAMRGGGMNGGMNGGGMNGGNGGMGGGMGGPPAGGMGGPPGGGMGGGFSNTGQEQKLWTRILLAYMR